MLKNKAPVIRSDGRLVRDFFYIEDAVKAHLLAAEKIAQFAGEAFHFSYETPLTIVEVVERILKMMNSDLRPIILNQTSDGSHDQYLCAEKARNLLGWQPVYDFNSGLSRTIEWYQKRPC